MSGASTHILVVGGGSRIAAALVPLLGDGASYASRRPGARPREVIVEDYGQIPPAGMYGVRCVINCVGVSVGSTAHLERINVDMPTRLAAAAKEAGVRHLIHISSFSVYGGAHLIDRETRPAPASDYGRSKLAADTALLALADDRFAVTILRLPLIYGEGTLGKLGQLLRLWKRVRILAVPREDVARSMISVDLTAAIIAQLAALPSRGIVFAADPRPFTYADTMQARPEPLHRLPLPRLITDLVERAAPAIGSRLFMNSLLADADNLAIEYRLASQLYRDVAAAELR